MQDAVPAQEILDFFREGFEHTAWRLETRRDYAADQGTEEYREFLRGVAPPHDTTSPWFVNAREQTARGKRIERVRLIDEPPSDNQQYLLATTPDNLAAGEDIRFMTRPDANQLGLPEYDFWLFDSRTMAVFNWDDPARRMELTSDPGMVLRACQARDAAWHHAARYEEFKTRVRFPM
ncbi:hypothetical protein OG204_14220 [Streptomyces sp. NBC_01387]|uniref:DUF6879 family protein n=1 Tax=unclassified Streptomyces TaxID=2593676 RepID=UPI0022527554|nr:MULTISPECIES: DUF6879 family protein [unclassified Streptomyces]MCX4550502.1 hypothetical protein [Streptomyces sp. NBC_01500]WSC21951.1 hypothetical protein OIE60_20950 [Streptomyces sp. NBC_01766]WSV55906.1 hypothetical protein OG282_20590 [Streptomyces sp. NBC_01014]